MGSLRFYGGVKEIGGNKIFLEEGDTKVWLDFGQSFSHGARALEKAINKVRPGKLFPIHTENAEKFTEIYDKVVIQEIGKEYKLS
jgi:mRNA degradation ribonuclease J1/J2